MLGAVVSKPIAKKITSLSWLSLAIFKQSKGEYTRRISAPSALASIRFFFAPGTLIVSPKVTKITLDFPANSIASSIFPFGIIQTGQPGPWINSTVGGNISFMPYLNIAWVCPPHISIIFIRSFFLPLDK